jgi:signal transduction histidine kinase
VTSIAGALRRRLVVGLLLALALSGTAVGLSVRRALTAQFDAALLAKAHLLAAVVKQEPSGTVVLDLDDAPMPEFERGEDPEYFQLRGPAGEVLARSRSLGAAELPSPKAGSWDLRLPDGRPGRAVAIDAQAHLDDEDQAPATGIPPPVVHLVVARHRRPLDQELAATWLALGAGGLLLLIGVPLLVSRAVRRGLRPLDDVARQAARIDAGSLGLRFDARVPDELAPICQRLNDLLERLEASFERERRFSADVAHELRTPLAELRTLAEVALRYRGDRGPSAAPLPGFEDVLGAAVHMEALVTALLTLARCESGRQPVAIQPVDLARLCADLWPTHERAARRQGLRTRADAGGPVLVGADPVLLGSVAQNLFANAVEYTPPGGEVRWTVEEDGGGGRLVVTNSNHDLDQADLPQVFDRFWRKDLARASSGGHGGLGLSLARAFVRLMSGSLRLELPRPDLVQVELRLPAPDSFSPARHLAVMLDP